MNTTSPDALRNRADELLEQHQLSIWKRTDFLFAWLLIAEWIACLLIACYRSPFTYSGASRSIHPHVLWATMYGGIIVLFPVYLAARHSGLTITRHAIAIAQMLMSGLFIHVGNGRIEMHFHVFGSLAFLAFYRDWRVLISASVVVALEHLLRGMLAPASIYGVDHASLWRTLEHAGWVIFEDIFLIASCRLGVREMRGIAENRAQLEQSYHDVERKVEERTAELKEAQSHLLKSARSAGMAEIATSVLHNVGNVLNSVNVSAMVVTDKLKQSEVASLAKVSDLIVEHKSDLAGYLTQDSRGKLLPEFITELATCLTDEQKEMQSELDQLQKGISHIKQIVAAQQSMAKSSNLHAAVNPATIFESAISMQSTTEVKDIEFIRDFQTTETAELDQHKVMQILINLISNARHAVRNRPSGQRKIRLKLERIDQPEGGLVRFSVNDSGMGISSENLQKIFAYGFTTKKEGHGFGLHSAANAAKELGGRLTAASAGLDQGATFTLEVPAEAPVVEEKVCQ